MNNIVSLSNRTEVVNNVIKGSFRENILIKAVRQILTWVEDRRTIQQLNMMSDSLLQDIGIERYEITDVVKYNKRAASQIIVAKQQTAELPKAEVGDIVKQAA